MTVSSDPTHEAEDARDDLATRLHRWVVAIIALIMGLDLVLILLEGQWLNAFLITTIICVIVAPIALGNRLPVRVPAEMQLVALGFVFAALFLGEVRSYYERIWWWDIALHTSSGLLLGILGFLLVYLLNESRNVDLHMRPRFVALFAFLFAVAVGAIWEIFEFGMDRAFGLQMQKPMLGDASGLTDTMWDLIVDTLGAFAISALGWWYMRRDADSFIEIWIQKFIARNPRLFKT